MIRFFIILIFLVPYFKEVRSEVLFKPLTANPFEARIGAMVQPAFKKVRLDIGASFDFKRFTFPSGNLGKSDLFDTSIAAIGADFFTYTRLRSEGNLKFPVETSDYYFGINGSFAGRLFNHKISARIRIAHISSHLVDGLAEGDSLLNPRAFIYSREFVDLAGAFNVNIIRLYAGLCYVYSTKPKNPSPLIPQLGFDFDEPLLSWLNLKGGYDFKLIGIDGKLSGVHSAQAGMFFIASVNTGILINLYGYKGRSMHGMFYNQNDSYIGFGFQLLF